MEAKKLTAKPTRKVFAASTLGLAMGLIVVWVMEMFLPEPVPSDVASAIGTVCAAVVGYVVPERA